MIELTDDPWCAFQKVISRYEVKRLDILTGFIGVGAKLALDALGVSSRIVIGLAENNPALSSTQIDELHALTQRHRLRSTPGLHAKMYVFDSSAVAVGSANFTKPGFEKLYEVLVLTDDRALVQAARRTFEAIWQNATPLTDQRISSIAILPARSPEESLIKAGIGWLARSKRSGFSPVSHKTGRIRSDSFSTQPFSPVRLCAYWPKWLQLLNEDDSLEWSTSPRVRVGDLQLFAITNQAGIQQSNEAGTDAIHSLWRASSKARSRTRGRWPTEADFDLVVRFLHPIPKAALVEKGVLNGGRWPQNPSGKIYRGWELKELVALLKSFNPKQSEKIHGAFLKR
jgi:hypothetical protein